jgi:hypothetical protein
VPSRSVQQVLQVQHMQQPQQSHQAASIDYDLLPRPSPYPLEGDVIAYRLLHVGADWTPQVGHILPAPSLMPQGKWLLPFLSCAYLSQIPYTF